MGPSGSLPAWLVALAGPARWTQVTAWGHSFLLVSGVYFPALTSLLSQKVRESERAFTYSAVGAGSQCG